jgi:signal transduction histidine kinase/CheY-like chemotaxis protein
MPARYEVLDLLSHPKFGQLPFVHGAPHFRYYCGVPLTTKNGVRIGSLFVMDNKVREPMARVTVRFMETMADNIIGHLESTKGKADFDRINHMNQCLTAFIDPENRTKKRKTRSSRKPQSSVGTVKGPGVQMGPEDESQDNASAHKVWSQRLGPKGRRRASREDSESDTKDLHETFSASSSAANSRKKADDDEHLSTFKRAASLLKDSLNLHPGSGVVFLDTGSSLHGSGNLYEYSSGDTSEDESATQTYSAGRRSSTGNVTHTSSGTWGPHGASAQSQSHAAKRPATILASSVVTSPGSDSDDSDRTPGMLPLPQSDLPQLIRRHPRGKIFFMDDDETGSSSSSGDEKPSRKAYNMPNSGELPSKSEMALLSKHFPGAKQVIFMPFWDPILSRFSAFFAYNNSPFRRFSRSPDFLHCIAFCNCIATEITRITTLAADQQKSDFLGSISHELRSPLHGILASCEFLEDSELTTFQKSLVDTADSCARTLLDTINMVLDYSKINAFERSMGKARHNKQSLPILAHTQIQPALNIYGDVDLAAITEEVVEGVATGQIFKDSLAHLDITDLPPGAVNLLGTDKSKSRFEERPDVEIIVDILPRDWTFITQPGAFRRVVMNIFGNALKYTSHGFIRVRLEASGLSHKHEDSPDNQMVKLTITDTGQGISAHYMKTKLFTPFAQESSIAPGTGLGLSLVRSIVTMLNGEIDIQSTIGVGTEVTVKFPMTQSSFSSSSGEPTSGSTATSAGSIERAKDDSIIVVRHKAENRKAMFVTGRASLEHEEAAQTMRSVVGRYLTQWYGFDLLVGWDKNVKPDLIMVSQADFLELSEKLQQVYGAETHPMILVLCDTVSRRDKADLFAGAKNVEAISCPFGPYKLARVVRLCLERLENIGPGDASATAAMANEPEQEIEEIVQTVEQVQLGGDIKVVQAGSMMANQEYAPLVVEAVTSSISSRSMEQTTGFPFPSSETQSPTGDPLSSAIKSGERSHPQTPGIPMVSSPLAAPPTTHRTPRLLLVDDNKVNLRLLQTFMQKRGYKEITLAEDGKQATNAYKSLIERQQPPDIIFMDISMPVMNGFEATRQIRDVEHGYREQLNPMETPPASMIIALTGLASGRDQSEAFTSGFDLYLVKPIAFKNVAKLLDNWEKNGGAATLGVPHGPVTADEESPKE